MPGVSKVDSTSVRPSGQVRPESAACGWSCLRARGHDERAQRPARRKAARGLKIDYTVLVSSMDGSCPVQKGMRIQFYPTMILVDRTGRIIQREQGATDATLARIDRAIATALK